MGIVAFAGQKEIKENVDHHDFPHSDLYPSTTCEFRQKIYSFLDLYSQGQIQ